MKGNIMEKSKIFNMKFAKVYPLLVNKAERKGRTKEEVDQIIHWLCGYTPEDIELKLKEDVGYKEFFDASPSLNPNRELITGKICGVRVEEIEDPTMKLIRYLDKLIDELARGKKMEKILREK